MDILMIGGTGTISYDATCYFLEKGHNVYLLNRGNRNDLSHEHLHYIIGNANNTENMKIALDGMHFDVVLDFIIYTKAQLEKRVPIYNELCKQFIFISSATVYAPTSKIITESSQLGNDKWYYSREKLECENYLRANKDNFKFVYTIIRPYITYDARRLPFPVIIMPYFSTSLTSSAGAFVTTSRISSAIFFTSPKKMCFISPDVILATDGRPVERLFPFAIKNSSSSFSSTLPIDVLIFSAVISPMRIS